MSEQYTEDSIRSLDWKEHIRLRPGMYIGKLGDGASQDDGIYVLVKEIIDNSIDEFTMGHGKSIDVTIVDKTVTIRDYGRGMPLGKVIECVSKINTGAKYDSKVFKKAVGLNGVGTKAVNAMSSYFKVQAIRESVTRIVEYERGVIISDNKGGESTNEKNGTLISFTPDKEIFGDYHYISEYIEKMLWNFAFLNRGMVINFNGQRIISKNGLKDLLEREINGNPVVYPIVHLEEGDFEFVITHVANQYGEEYYSFVNGQHTTQGGTHLVAFREAVVKTVRDFYKKDYDHQDIRASINAAVSIKVQEPVFESQTKTKLGSSHIEPGGITIRNYVIDIVCRNFDNYLHKNHEVAEALLARIQLAEKERKEMAGIKKLAREAVKKSKVHNKKLRDCRVHYNKNHERRLESSIFITEGDSASGSITKIGRAHV